MNLALWDTRVREDNERIRVLSYPQTDIFLICFDIASQFSFDSVRRTWVHETSFHENRAACILVGLKADLRHDSATVRLDSSIHSSRSFAKFIFLLFRQIERLRERDRTPVSKETATELVKYINLAGYCEFSGSCQTPAHSQLTRISSAALTDDSSVIFEYIGEVWKSRDWSGSGRTEAPRQKQARCSVM